MFKVVSAPEIKTDLQAVLYGTTLSKKGLENDKLEISSFS